MYPASRTEGADWRPCASPDAIVARAALLRELRSFFEARGVLEVETPLLGSCPSMDTGIGSLSTRLPGAGAADGGRRLYLQPSPEHAMKRLLAAGAGSIYQICKAFRADESGRHHNPEFTILEWYRLDVGYEQLIEEVEALLTVVLGLPSAARLTYRDAFSRWVGLDPIDCEDERLRQRAHADGLFGAARSARATCVDFLFSARVEPQLRARYGRRPVFVTDYPAGQAPLARSHPRDPRVAERFELFVDGLELVNGYTELTDPMEQRRRFEAVQAERRARDEDQPIDERLLEALEHGLPPCAGVAVGVDRLLMLITGSRHIDEVLAFPVSAL